MFSYFVKVALILIIPYAACHADIMGSMQRFYNKFGGVSNSSKGTAFSDQQGGYLSGGSLFVRNPVRNANLMQITPPGFRAGCGGIDIWTGGMSFISGEQLRNMMKSIVSSIPSYAFMLGVETYAPQLHTIMQQLNKMAADFNRMSINSCEASAAIVSSVWPKSDLGSQAACRMLSANEGVASDWAKSRHNCGQGEGSNNILDRHGSGSDLLVGEFNLAWKVLDKIGFDFDNSGSNLGIFAPSETAPSNKQVLKEILMTLTGTVINKKEQGSFRQVHYTGKGGNESFLNALMKGGDITYYGCGNEKCTTIVERTITLSENDALLSKIRKMLDDIVSKIQQDTGAEKATDGEMALVNATTLPLYKLINVTTAHQKGRAPISIAEYAEIVAFDVVFKYVTDVFDMFQDNLVRLKEIQFSDEHIKPFIDGIGECRKTLFQHRTSVFAKMDMLLGFMQKTQLVEKQIHHLVSNLPNEYGA